MRRCNMSSVGPTTNDQATDLCSLVPRSIVVSRMDVTGGPPAGRSTGTAKFESPGQDSELAGMAAENLAVVVGVRDMTKIQEREPSEEQIDLVVCNLCQIVRETHLDYAIRVGSLVIHYFYGGDMKMWRHRGPKTASFRRLANHPNLPMSASALYRCVAVYDLCERLDVVSKWRRITASHLRLVLRFDEGEQRRLLSLANSERWSVHRLEAEARKLSLCARGQRRTARSELKRRVSSLERVIEMTSSVLAGEGDLEALMTEKYSDLREAIETSIRSLEQAREILILSADVSS
jgi:hypothetical protein